jgi:hypothetical protein
LIINLNNNNNFNNKLIDSLQSREGKQRKEGEYKKVRGWKVGEERV